MPGLADHHLHLLATAASGVRCGPPDVDDSGTASGGSCLGNRDQGGWVRATGYDELIAGDLDAAALDALHAMRPVRLQHRSGALWVLNSAALSAIGVNGPADDLPAGVERDTNGHTHRPDLAGGRVVAHPAAGDDGA